jgi:hypothetical protein
MSRENEVGSISGLWPEDIVFIAIDFGAQPSQTAGLERASSAGNLTGGVYGGCLREGVNARTEDVTTGTAIAMSHAPTRGEALGEIKKNEPKREQTIGEALQARIQGLIARREKAWVAYLDEYGRLKKLLDETYSMRDNIKDLNRPASELLATW